MRVSEFLSECSASFSLMPMLLGKVAKITGMLLSYLPLGGDHIIKHFAVLYESTVLELK